jgi:hypothetical protein
MKLGHMRRAGPAAGALLATALLTAACASSGAKTPGVAAISSASATSSATSGTKASAINYARCMRAHGIKDYPDPNADGDIEINAGPGSDMGPDNPHFKTADNACKALRPQGKQLSPAEQAKVHAAALKYSQCMRSHGIKDFPDPNAQGGMSIKVSGQSSDLNPNNPQFQSADKACKHLMPNGGKGGSTHISNGGGK